MVVVVFQTASIAAGAEVSVMDTVQASTALKSSVLPRAITRIGLSGATVNTGIVNLLIGTDTISTLPNGVTNTAGAPIKQEDSYSRQDFVAPNENIDLRVRNTSGGALQYYVYIEVEDILED